MVGAECSLCTHMTVNNIIIGCESYSDSVNRYQYVNSARLKKCEWTHPKVLELNLYINFFSLTDS